MSTVAYPWPAPLVPIPHPGRVLYLSGEDDATDIHHRLWSMTRDMAAGEVDRLAENLAIHPIRDTHLI